MVSISRPREQAVTNDAAEQQQIDRIGNPAAAAVEIGGHHDGERSGRQHEVRHRASGRGQRQEGEEQNPQKIDGGFVGARPHRAAAPPKPRLLQCLCGALLITALEFTVGVADNLVMGWNVWDYSDMPLNLYGQICLPFTGLWFLLCIPAFGICRIAERRFHPAG